MACGHATTILFATLWFFSCCSGLGFVKAFGVGPTTPHQLKKEAQLLQVRQAVSAAADAGQKHPPGPDLTAGSPVIVTAVEGASLIVEAG